MNVRTILVLGLAVICGTSAAMGVHALSAKKQGPTKPVKTAPVIVAAVEIQRGTSLRAELLCTRQWPENLLPDGAFSELDDVLERVALSSLSPGEPILAPKVGEIGVGAATLVEEGMRAYTILTPTFSSGVGGFVLPGNRVDVLLTVTRNMNCDKDGGGRTTTLLQNVEILAAGQRLDHGEKKGEGKQSLRHVTLLVTPQMAAKLSLAATVGTLHLALRNDADMEIAETDPVTANDLRFLQEGLLADEPGGDEENKEKKSKLSFSDFMGILAAASANAKPAAVTTSWEPPPKPLVVRTLRGNSAGMIYVPRSQGG
jgi:pilus assembly protein CpaB